MATIDQLDAAREENKRLKREARRAELDAYQERNAAEERAALQAENTRLQQRHPSAVSQGRPAFSTNAADTDRLYEETAAWARATNPRTT